MCVCVCVCVCVCACTHAYDIVYIVVIVFAHITDNTDLHFTLFLYTLIFLFFEML